MKKLVYGSLLFALIGIGAVSCKKEVINKTSNSLTSENIVDNTKSLKGYTTDGRMLIVDSKSTFETFSSNN